MEVSRFNGLVAKPMSVERGCFVVSMRKLLKRLNCASAGVHRLKAGVNEKNAGTSLPDALSDWQNDRANPFGFAQGSLLLEMQSR